MSGEVEAAEAGLSILGRAARFLLGHI